MTDSDDMEARIEARALEIRIELEQQKSLNIGAVILHAAICSVRMDVARQHTEKLRKIAVDMLNLAKKRDAEFKEFRVGLEIRTDKLWEAMDNAIDTLEPLADRGIAWHNTQKNNGFKRHEKEQEKHKDWRQWQASERIDNPNFATYSKQEQARRLKRKYDIEESVSTIAKRLDPRPTK